MGSCKLHKGFRGPKPNCFAFELFERIAAGYALIVNFCSPSRMIVADRVHEDLFVPFFQETQIYKTDSASCENEHSFLLSVVNGRVQHSLCAPSERDLKKWWNGLQQHMLDQGALVFFWKIVSCLRF